jgi:hypothetical protein
MSGILDHNLGNATVGQHLGNTMSAFNTSLANNPLMAPALVGAAGIGTAGVAGAGLLGGAYLGGQALNAGGRYVAQPVIQTAGGMVGAYPQQPQYVA